MPWIPCRTFHILQPTPASEMHKTEQICRGNTVNQTAIATYGGVKPLVELLQPSLPDGRSNTPVVQANAACALSAICHGNVANQTAAASFGCLGQLSVMARGNSKGEYGLVEAEAAGALWALSEGHEENKVASSQQSRGA